MVKVSPKRTAQSFLEISVKKYGNLAHTKWECKYHVVFIPNRKQTLYKELRQYLGWVFRDLARDMESEVEEGYLCKDHVHMLLSIPPKYPVSYVVGYLKGKSAIYVARNFLGYRQNVGGQHLWARGYFISTVGSAAAPENWTTWLGVKSPLN